MTTKLQNYIQLAGQTAAQVTKNPQNWVGFLNTVSNVYRYTLPDQLMIHSQRPKATACAEFDLWTRRMNRHIRRGSKGIGLIAINRNGYPKIRYVFDIGDTELKRNSASLFQWRYKQEYRGIVTKALEEQFGVSGEKGLVYRKRQIFLRISRYSSITYNCSGYTNLLTSGRLNTYLADIDRQAQERFVRLIDGMKQTQGITERLKAENALEWTGQLNNIRAHAREIVNSEIINA